MRKLGMAVLFVALATVVPGYALAEGEVTGDMVKVHQCPSCGYTVASECPMCGAKLEEKQLTAADAQAAIDKTKDMIRGRS